MQCANIITTRKHCEVGLHHRPDTLWLH